MLRRTARKSEAWQGEDLVFLVGHPRSGTTFLGRLLGAHPSIGYWEEAALIHVAAQFHQTLRDLHRHLQVDAGLDVLRLTERDSTRAQFPLDDEATDEADRRALAHTREVVKRLVDDFRSRSGRPMVLEKTPAAVGMLQPMAALLPDARAVHIVRDPRDIVASMQRITRQKGRPEFIPAEGDVVDVTARQWLELVSNGLDVGARLGGSVVHVLRHEDLVADPKVHVGRLLDFLGLPWCREIDEFLAAGMPPPKPKKNRALSGIDPGRSGVWAERLTPEDAARVVSLAGGLMARLGYESDGPPLRA